jgi:AraC family transcriptional regulator
MAVQKRFLKARSKAGAAAPCPAVSPETCFPLTYLHGGVVWYRPGDTLGPRVMADFEVVLIVDGHVVYSADGQTYHAPPGAIILPRPGFHEFYRWDPQQQTQHAFVHFKIETTPRHWPEPRAWPILVAKPEPVCAALLQHVVKLCAGHPRWPVEQPTQEVCCLMKTLLETLLTRSSATSAPLDAARPQPLQRAMQWMRQMVDDHPEQTPRLAEVAASTGISAKHLCRVFRQHVGCGPMAAYRRLRLHLALALLTRSNLNIKQIANRCGFASQFQFSRNFSQTFGMSPTAARRRVQQGKSPPKSSLPADLAPRIHW